MDNKSSENGVNSVPNEIPVENKPVETEVNPVPNENL